DSSEVYYQYEEIEVRDGRACIIYSIVPNYVFGENVVSGTGVGVVETKKLIDSDLELKRYEIDKRMELKKGVLADFREDLLAGRITAEQYATIANKLINE
ncbi:MAG: hypothetical protein WCT77_03575, partial [Bacteroidota bacterium]